MSSKFSQILLANRKVILDAFKTIEIMNKNRPKDAKVEISQSKSVKFHEIAYSKSTNKQEKVMKELNEFLNSGELKLNKYSNTKHHTAKKSVDTINKNYIKTGNQEKYINDIQKSLNAPHRPLSVSYLVYRDPVKQDEDAVVDAALKAMAKAVKGRKRTQEDFEQFGGINHATISCDPAKYGIVKSAFVKRYLNDDIKTHELSQTNPIYNMYLSFLCNDKEARINLTSAQADTYLKAIKIIEIKKVEYDDEMEKQYKDSKSSKIKDFNMDRQNKHEDVKMIYSKWRIEEYNPNAETCGELVSNNKFKVKNSCVINCIISKLGDRYSLSREKILKQIGRLDLLECDETPLSINDILPFFYKHKINLICFDALGHVILNTKLPNEKANAVHLMVTDNHCILLNDIRSIAQIINADDYENAEEFVLGSNFNTPSESVERKHKFINTVDDIVEIVRNNISDEDAVVHVIHRNDDIDSVLWNLVNVCGSHGLLSVI